MLDGEDDSDEEDEDDSSDDEEEATPKQVNFYDELFCSLNLQMHVIMCTFCRWKLVRKGQLALH